MIAVTTVFGLIPLAQVFAVVEEIHRIPTHQATPGVKINEVILRVPVYAKRLIKLGNRAMGLVMMTLIIGECN